jgi:hypothetical protein
MVEIPLYKSLKGIHEYNSLKHGFSRMQLSAFEQRGNNSECLMDLYLNARARIWPEPFHMCAG